MTTARIKNLLAPRSFRSLRIEPSWELALFAGLTLAALALRLWELDGRTMHYDESLHIHNAWRLAEGQGYSHSPWMHGPFQINLTALMFKLFSDSDFTARLGYALFGALLVGLPYFFRTYLGRTGAVVTSVLLALSPSLLYFSRFGRNEILMVFFAVALLIVMWRYLNEGKNRYLYIASALLALIFATKETSYILVTIFGAALFLMAITELVPWALSRSKLSDLTGPAAFLVLLVTLSLPPVVGVVQHTPGAPWTRADQRRSWGSRSARMGSAFRFVPCPLDPPRFRYTPHWRHSNCSAGIYAADCQGEAVGKVAGAFDSARHPDLHVGLLSHRRYCS